MTKASQSKAVKGSGEHIKCRVKSCTSTVYADGLCHVHALQKHYRDATAEIGVEYAVVGAESKSKTKG